jgi:RHS repeat-associated protein
MNPRADQSRVPAKASENQAFKLGAGGGASAANALEIPKVSLPKGGGALRSIDEKFAVNAANGTASFSLPLPFSQSRTAFGPALTLGYNSGSGNGPFGLGWSAEPGAIQRRSDKKLPTYQEESDVFQLAGTEDLVPMLRQVGVVWQPVVSADGLVRQYCPRVEGSFARIERIQVTATGIFYWKVTTRDNVTTFYGRTAAARLADPADATRIYRWLPELSYDDQGNCLEYEYKAEDGANVPPLVHEQHRQDGRQPFANRYLKRIRHGNRTPYYPDPAQPYAPPAPATDYFFEVVLDYGEHDDLAPAPLAEPQAWAYRYDAFSDGHPGFEVRTYRLCRRVLFFHSFEELSAPGSVEPCLVRSVDLTYRHFDFAKPAYAPQEADFITAIRQQGYERLPAGGYARASLPAVEFTYNELSWNTEVQVVSRKDAPNLPVGLSSGYQWTDFYGEGLAGVLSEQAGGWYYAANEGQGRFAPAALVAPRPSFGGLSTGRLQLMDLAADGGKQVVSLAGDVPGFFEQTPTGDWLPFRAFERFPTVSPHDPTAKWIDLNGDGLPELVVAEDQVFVWYENRGRLGYDAPEYAPKPWDEARGPAVVFAEERLRIYAADMSGDGLSDLVRIRNGEVCYWPNLGYGRFGAKVTMGNAPVFDTPDGFDATYLHLADVSGTGATDLLYTGPNRVMVYLNLAGNAWSAGQVIAPFPSLEWPNQLTVCDFIGNGTGSLVWSSPAPAHADAPLRYLDLMGGRKPYILTQYRNNLGKSVALTYRNSTQFYLADKHAGTPWRTKLPFPVQCLSQVAQHDAVTNLRLTTHYSYHHGYYDAAEREFRGFGRVEQRDTETFENWVRQDASNIVDQPLHEPVVLTKTWYHTGAMLDRERVLTQFETEYWYHAVRQLDPALVVAEHQLPDARLPAGLTPLEYREALRACKGMALRQEVFALDAPAAPTLAEQVRQAIPYSVSTHTAQVQLVQPQQANAHTVFMRLESESLQLHYEREITDPRIAHSLNTRFDELGHVLESAAVVYGRQQSPAGSSAAVQAAQGARHVTYTHTDYTHDVRTPAAYRLRAACAVRTAELTGVAPTAGFFAPDELRLAFAAATEIPYEALANSAQPQRRNIEHSRTLFLSDDTVQALPLGELSARGLTYETYQLAFSQGLLTQVFGDRVSAEMLGAEGHYAEGSLYKPTGPEPATRGLFPATDPDGDWWIPSGRALYPAAPAAHFYQPDGYRDATGQLTKVRRWRDYHLMLAETEDALGNRVVIEEIDFRFLQPRQVLDANQNRSAVRYDRRGLVAGTALLGKGTEADDFEGFQPDLSPAEIAAFLADPEATAAGLLQHATSRFVYDFTAFQAAGQPAFVATIGRETHHRVAAEVGEATRLQLGFEYTGGLGQVVMKKVQAEPGPAKQLVAQPNGALAVVETDTTPRLRWVGNGRTVLNNKGKPVRTYEPYFSVTHQYESARELVEVGVSSVLFYDAVGRLIRTEHPNQTVARHEFGAWQSLAFDENDTVLSSGWYAARNSGALGPEEQRAAQLAAVHADTPTVTVLDSLGRAFLSRAQNRYLDPATNTLVVGAPAETVVEFDIEGNQRSITDARGNVVMAYQYDRLGHTIWQRSMDAGEHHLLNDCQGKALYGWDADERRFRSRYDALHRPTEQLVRLADGTEPVIERSEYGTSSAPDVALNRNLQLVRHYDGAGTLEQRSFDFKGNPLDTVRQFVADYRATPDWNNPALVAMQAAEFRTQMSYDALSRPVALTLPDSSRLEPTFNQSNLLKAVAATIGTAPRRQYVAHIAYDARGQRQRIEYGNHTATTYAYDPLTLRLRRLQTRRTQDEAGAPANELLQDLAYTYDPVGNITALLDAAQQTLFYNGAVVEPSQQFEYDALYQLIGATGREHAAQQQPVSEFDAFRTQLVHKGDGLALQNYTQRYEYDAVGNMLRMIHRAGRGALQNRWTRTFNYAADNNQLLSAEVGGTTSAYPYDAHGNMRAMPHLPAMRWDVENQLQQLDLGGGGTAYYQYDAQGQRVRKVVERPGGLVQERLYVGQVEVYTETQAGAVQLRRESVHVLDDTRRLALVETRTDVATAPLIRFQYSNHLGTSALELDEQARIISYEEYYPFGSSSYQAGRSQAEVGQKRYRYTGKERDEESGLYYHGARYYAPWLARWTKADPIGVGDGVNCYAYVKNNPIKSHDPTGMWESPISLRTALVVVAVVAVAVVVTVATAGVGTALLGAATAGMSATGAAVTTGVGTVAIAAASGSLSSAAATATANSLTGGHESVKDAAVAGGIVGAATGLIPGVSAARSVGAAVRAGSSVRAATAAVQASRAVQGAAQASRAVRVARGAATGMGTSALYEAARQEVSGEAKLQGGLNVQRVATSGAGGALLGGVLAGIVGPGVGLVRARLTNSRALKAVNKGLKERVDILRKQITKPEQLAKFDSANAANLADIRAGKGVLGEHLQHLTPAQRDQAAKVFEQGLENISKDVEKASVAAYVKNITQNVPGLDDVTYVPGPRGQVGATDYFGHRIKR